MRLYLSGRELGSVYMPLSMNVKTLVWELMNCGGVSVFVGVSECAAAAVGVRVYA